MSKETPTQKLLGFIIDQNLDLDNYPSLEDPLRERFQITSLIDGNGEDATKRLVNVIIDWERDWTTDSLEETLNQLFQIEERLNGLFQINTKDKLS